MCGVSASTLATGQLFAEENERIMGLNADGQDHNMGMASREAGSTEYKE
jgi:hypothetical protein